MSNTCVIQCIQVQKQPQLKQNRVVFKFPNDVKSLKTVNNIEHWKQLYSKLPLLANMIDPPGYKTNIKFTKYPQRKYIYCKSYGCKSYFYYKIDEKTNLWNLIQYRLLHRHLLCEQIKKQQIKTKGNQILISYLVDMIQKNNNITYRQIKSQFSNQSLIDDHSLRYKFQKAKIIYKNKQKQVYLFQEIQKNSFTFMCSKYEQIKSDQFRFLISCESMLKTLEKWGKVIYFTVLINQKYDEKQNDIFIGAFYGFNSNLQFVPFAIFLTKINLDAIFLLLKQFLEKSRQFCNFKIQHGTNVKIQFIETIIVTYFTFGATLFKKICDNKIYTGNFIYQANSYINQLKKKSDILYNHKLSLQRLHRLVLVQQNKKFQDFIQQDNLFLGYNFSTQQALIYEEQLFQVTQKVCISQIQSFIGSYYLQSSIVNENQFFRVYKNFMKNTQGFVDSFFIFCNILKNNVIQTQKMTDSNHETGNYQSWLKIPQLSKIKFLVKKNIFKILIDKILKTFYLKSYKQNVNLIFVYNNNKQTSQNILITFHSEYQLENHKLLNQEQSYYYEVQFDRIKQKWTCNCGYYIRRGLPCQHQLVVCIRYKYSIQRQISQFWMRKQDNFLFKDKPKPKRGRPKQSQAQIII